MIVIHSGLVQPGPVQSGPVQSGPVQSNPVQSKPAQSNVVRATQCTKLRYSEWRPITCTDLFLHIYLYLALFLYFYISSLLHYLASPSHFLYFFLYFFISPFLYFHFCIYTTRGQRTADLNGHQEWQLRLQRIYIFYHGKNKILSLAKFYFISNSRKKIL